MLSEPLVHFVALGAAMFAVCHWMSKSEAPQPDQIMVTAGRIENLAAGFARTWQRPPTAEELAGLVREYVREEMASREAMALGLDQEDTIIRRRLRQKLEFVAEDLSVLAEPSDGELRAYLEAQPEKFRQERRYWLRIEPEADLVMLRREFEGITAGEIAQQLGHALAEKLDELAIGQWHGPVESGYGPCRVLLGRRLEGRLPELEEVRDQVRREWASARRMEASEKFYQSLLQRYTVTFERPASPDGMEMLAEARP
jgi:hypothetical protein